MSRVAVAARPELSSAHASGFEALFRTYPQIVAGMARLALLWMTPRSAETFREVHGDRVVRLRPSILGERFQDLCEKNSAEDLTSLEHFELDWLKVYFMALQEIIDAAVVSLLPPKS